MIKLVFNIDADLGNEDTLRERKRLIRNAAFRQLMSRGYNGVSYKSIAEEAGLESTHVQYYYPKKTLIAIDFFRHILEIVATTIESEKEYVQAEWPLKLFYLAAVGYSFFLGTEEMRKLTLEAYADREITATLLEQDVAWVEHNQIDGKLADSDIVASTGGIYELIYYQLSHGIVPDAKLLAYRNVVSVFYSQPEEMAHVAKMLNESKEDDSFIERSVNLVRERCVITD